MLYAAFLCLAFPFISLAKDSVLMVYGDYVEQNYYSDANNHLIYHEKDFSEHQAFHLEDLVNSIPGMNLTKGTSRARFFTMRGIGERSSYEGMPNYSVGIVIDDIDYSGIGSISSLNGISQLEISKGPQSTRLGPAALAGMVYMKTAEAENRLRGKAAFSYSSFNTFQEELNLSTPLGRKWGLSFNLFKNDSNGYIKNTFLRRDDTSGLDERGLRSKLSYKNGNLKGVFSIHHLKNENGYDYFTQDNSLKTRSDKPGEDNQETNAQSLKVEYKNSYKTKVITLLSHLNDHSLYSYDEDWGNNALWFATPGWNQAYDYNIEFLKNRRHYAIEQRVQTRFDLILGFYFKDAKEDFEERGYENESIRKEIFGGYKTQNTAIFFEKTHYLGEKNALEYGGRLEYRKANYKDTLSNQFTPTESLNAFNIAFLREHAPQKMSYFKIAKGFKAGGFNIQSNIPSERKSFEKEELYSLELGNKIRWNDVFQLNTAVFFMYRDNVQVRTSFQDDPGDPSSFTFYNDNATNGNSYGAETELSWKVLSDLEVKMNLSLLRTEYNSFVLGSRNLLGREFANAPEYKINTLFIYRFNPNFYSNLNIFFSDNYFFSNSHEHKAPSFNLVDLKFGFTKAGWDISLWSKNIFDQKSFSRGFFFGNEPPNFEDRLYTQRNAPRTIGMSCSYSF